MKRRIARVFVLTALAACASSEPGQSGGTEIKVGDPVDINGDGKLDGLATDSNSDGVADSVDLDGDGLPDALLPGVTPPGLGDAAAGGDGDDDGIDSGVIQPGDGDQGDGDGDVTSPPDAGGGDGDDPLVI